MHDLTDRAEALAKRLLNENQNGRSWRTIAREDYGNKVNFATLNRIAIHAGTWIPKDRRILKVLGIVEPKPEEFDGQKKIRSRIRAMVKETKRAITWN